MKMSAQVDRRGRRLVAGVFLVLGVFQVPQHLEAQQTGTVSGTVLEAMTHEPVSSAQVTVAGTDLGALSDAEGAYRIEGVPVGPGEIRIQRLGYAPMVRSVEIEAGLTLELNVELEVSVLALDGLVVTALGVQRRRELGNSASTIRASREVEMASPPSLSTLLQGRAPGVQVLQSSGTVGAASSITIRGHGSISLSNTPLIYVDGARVSNTLDSGPSVGGQTISRLDDLSLDDIEAVEIVKGPSAATLYGTEAAAGVIRITTKRGRTGMNEWTFRSELGANWDDTDWPDRVFNPRAFFGEQAPDTLYRMNLFTQDGTDLDPWRTGLEQSYGVSFRGGIEGVTYYLSTTLGHREGSLPNNEMTRRNVRGNFNIHPSDRVDISLSTGLGSHSLALPENDLSGFGFLGAALMGSPWLMPLVRTDPTTGDPGIRTCPLDFEVSRAFGVPLGTEGCPGNPFSGGQTFEDAATIERGQKIERFTGSATVNFRPIDVIEASGTVGYDQFSTQTRTFFPVDPAAPFGDLSAGFRETEDAVHRNVTLDGTISATHEITPELRSTTSVGGQFFAHKVEATGSVGRTLPSGTKSVGNAVRTEGSEVISETRIMGVFVQQQVAFRDRIFVTPAVRIDESSAFGKNLGREAYPRAMASYVISEEEWFPGSQFDSFRLRGAWGESGQQPSAFASLQLLSAERVTFRGEDRAGISLDQPGNPDLRPERGREVELGFEADAVGGRLGVDFTWYRQVTQDAITTRFLAPSTGFPSQMYTNIGEARNRGLELGLSAVAVSRPDVRWDWRLNAGKSKGKITRLEEPIFMGIDGVAQRHQEGYPFGSYFSVDYFIGEDGDVESTEEAVFIGHPTPEFEGSLSTTLELLGRVTLHADLRFAGGHQLFNSTQEFACGFLGGGRYGGTCPEIFETEADGGSTDRARIKQVAASRIHFAPWMEDADFARLRTVSARIELPARWLESLGGTRGSFTLVGENLALFTGYSGVDPEVNFAGGAQAVRSEFLTLPPGKRVTGRLAITF